LLPGLDDATGTPVGIVTYQPTAVKMIHSFLSWAVIFDVTTQEVFLLREQKWTVDVDAFAAGPRKGSADASDGAPTRDPVTKPPYLNDFLHDPTASTQGPLGAATTTFEK
jgi:hypothetical protein